MLVINKNYIKYKWNNKNLIMKRIWISNNKVGNFPWKYSNQIFLNFTSQMFSRKKRLHRKESI